MVDVALVIVQLAVHACGDESGGRAVLTIVRLMTSSTVSTDWSCFCRTVGIVVVILLAGVTPLNMEVIIHSAAVPKASAHTVSSVFK
jgi:hypothetical protein